MRNTFIAISLLLQLILLSNVQAENKVYPPSIKTLSETVGPRKNVDIFIPENLTESQDELINDGLNKTFKDGKVEKLSTTTQPNEKKFFSYSGNPSLNWPSIHYEFSNSIINSIILDYKQSPDIPLSEQKELADKNYKQIKSYLIKTGFHNDYSLDPDDFANETSVVSLKLFENAYGYYLQVGVYYKATLKPIFLNKEIIR